ncbi:MAG TPA: hypothetical protein VJY62_06935 [Bacteroidia bacterium]|nr:hypothetical protein [Bacteroidia bacterium]
MPFRIVQTKNTNDAITLSVDVKFGHKASSVIMMDHAIIATVPDSFQDLFLGTNNELRDKTITVTTSVMKTTPSIDSDVDYQLDGAAQNYTDHSSKPACFQNGVNVVAHTMEYTFI